MFDDEAELVAQLSRLPATGTPGARRHVTDMIRERLGGRLDLPHEADRETYLRTLVGALGARAGGFAALMAVVSQLGPVPEHERAIRSLLARLERERRSSG